MYGDCGVAKPIKVASRYGFESGVRDLFGEVLSKAIGDDVIAFCAIDFDGPFVVLEGGDVIPTVFED